MLLPNSFAPLKIRCCCCKILQAQQAAHSHPVQEYDARQKGLNVQYIHICTSCGPGNDTAMETNAGLLKGKVTVVSFQYG